MKNILICMLLTGLLCGCNSLLPCFEYQGVYPGPDSPDTQKKVHIINHTNNTYTDNALYSLYPMNLEKNRKEWQLLYDNRPSYVVFIKINKIQPKETLNKAGGKELVLEKASVFISASYNKNCDKKYIQSSDNDDGVFLLSLNSGKQKVFFGAHDYDYKPVEKINRDDCTVETVKWKIHPVFQGKKEVYIHIYEDKVEIEPLQKVHTMEIVLSKERNEKVTLEFAKLPLVSLENCK